MSDVDKRTIRNKPLKRIRLLFILMFIGLMANILYFVIVQADQVVINDYNPRMAEIEAGVMRGDILDRSGRPLATSVIRNGQQVRVYPFGSLFAHSVGYTGVGNTGIEAYNNLDLIRSNNNFKDRLTDVFNWDLGQGNSVITTFDADLQQLASDLLGEQRGAIVAMDPMTGEILAMVSKPDFDPNTIESTYEALMGDQDSATFLNRASQGLYPPASTYKILTTISYLEEHKAANFFHYCEGQLFVGQKVIHCYNNHAHGRISLEEAFALSCNTAFAKMEADIDVDRLNAISELFFYNESMPLEIATKDSSFELTSESSPNEIVETIIGQGKTLITPLNNVMIASAVANQGVSMQPFISKQVVSDEGEVVSVTESKAYRTIMTPAMAATIEGYMIETSRMGTAKALDTTSYDIASKTGTAENSQGAAHAWYIGYAPANNPQIALAILVENVGSSTENSVPIADALYKYYVTSN